MKDIKTIKFDKLVFEMKYLEAELDYSSEVMRSAGPEFQKLFQKEMEERGAKHLLFPEKEKKLNRAQRRAAKKASKGTQKIFKMIAKELHPDKLVNLSGEEKEKKENRFLEATEAKEQDNILKLYAMARELNIEVEDLSEEHFAIFEAKIKDLKQEIKNTNLSWVSVWHRSNDEGKKEVIKKYADFFISSFQDKTESE